MTMPSDKDERAALLRRIEELEAQEVLSGDELFKREEAIRLLLIAKLPIIVRALSAPLPECGAPSEGPAPRTAAVRFMIGDKTPLDDAYQCFCKLQRVSDQLERELADLATKVSNALHNNATIQEAQKELGLTDAAPQVAEAEKPGVQAVNLTDSPAVAAPFPCRAGIVQPCYWPQCECGESARSATLPSDIRDCFNNIVQYAHKTDFVVQEAKNGLLFLDAAARSATGKLP